MIAYDRDGITIVCADNTAIEWPVADFVLTDPPYSDATHNGARSLEASMGSVAMGMTFSSITDSDVLALFGRLGAVAKRWVVSFLDWRHVATLDRSPPETLRFVRHGVWVKPNGAPQFTGDRPAQGWEALAILHRANEKLRWNGGGKSSVYSCNKPHHDHRISPHPNAKPIPLLVDLINDFSEIGDLVFDPFAGSGAVAVAAKLAKRRAFVIERDQYHVDNLVHYLAFGAIRRVVSIPTGQLNLFEEKE